MSGSGPGSGSAADGAAWPAPEPARWQTLLRNALEADLAADLAAVRDQAKGIRKKLYGLFSLNWTGTHHQWRDRKSVV
jgi:hypothetical protein